MTGGQTGTRLGVGTSESGTIKQTRLHCWGKLGGWLFSPSVRARIQNEFRDWLIAGVEGRVRDHLLVAFARQVSPYDLRNSSPLCNVLRITSPCREGGA